MCYLANSLIIFDSICHFRSSIFTVVFIFFKHVFTYSYHLWSCICTWFSIFIFYSSVVLFFVFLQAPLSFYTTQKGRSSFRVPLFHYIFCQAITPYLSLYLISIFFIFLWIFCTFLLFYFGCFFFINLRILSVSLAHILLSYFP